MTARYHKYNKGLTLIEVLVAMAVIFVAIIGAIGFRYYAALDARKADVKITASRVGSMLLEGWKGVGGLTDYDPIVEFSSNLTISVNASGPAVPSGFTKLGNYHIIVNRVNYYATMSYKDSTSSELGILNVEVAWLSAYQAGTVSSSDQSIKLTKYVNN